MLGDGTRTITFTITAKIKQEDSGAMCTCKLKASMALTVKLSWKNYYIAFQDACFKF